MKEVTFTDAEQRELRKRYELLKKTEAEAVGNQRRRQKSLASS